MQVKSQNQEQTPAPQKGRGGRPSANRAGDVDRRLLDAARRLFLANGFDATSCELVAADAGAGKASLYARYANKEALFTAVVRRNVETMLAHPVDLIPTELPARERLRVVGSSILIHALQPDVVSLMRVVIATA
ncbi:MAG: Transcriptional regulator, TetR family, partial [Devosia sp.]|nr:Transcriptional regulator, TetR family [Devosia sp.]